MHEMPDVILRHTDVQEMADRLWTPKPLEDGQEPPYNIADDVKFQLGLIFDGKKALLFHDIEIDPAVRGETRNLLVSALSIAALDAYWKQNLGPLTRLRTYKSFTAQLSDQRDQSTGLARVTAELDARLEQFKAHLSKNAA